MGAHSCALVDSCSAGQEACAALLPTPPGGEGWFPIDWRLCSWGLGVHVTKKLKAHRLHWSL